VQQFILSVLQRSVAGAMAKNLQTAGHSLFVCTDEYDRIWKMIKPDEVQGGFYTQHFAPEAITTICMVAGWVMKCADSELSCLEIKGVRL
jgi:hypothetical protein